MGNPVTFTVPAGFHRTDEILQLDRRIKAIGKDVQIHAYDTVQGLSWNGGRLMFNRDFIKDEKSPWRADLTITDLDVALERARRLNDAGVPVNLVFNNTLESLDVEDEAGNYLLHHLHNGMNGVTIASESLRQHVAANYPKYATTASICFVYTKPEQYQRACQKYDKVVVMPTLAYTPELLEGLPMDKLVFIVNDNCYLFCLRKDHYDYISRCSLSGNNTVQEQERNAPRGGCFLKDPKYREHVAKTNDPKWVAGIEKVRKEQLSGEGLGIKDMEHNFTITPAARRELIRMGVTCFKLQGRDYVDASFQAKVADFLEKIVREEL